MRLEKNLESGSLQSHRTWQRERQPCTIRFHPAVRPQGPTPIGGRSSKPIDSLIEILVIPPRIEQLDLEVHEILRIPGHENQLMLNGDRRDLGIGCGWGAAGPIGVDYARRISVIEYRETGDAALARGRECRRPYR